MTLPLTRRQVLGGGTAAAAWVMLGVPRQAKALARGAVAETKVISHQAEYYHGWATVARCKSGRLLLAYSGSREGHVCPFGRVELMQSDDEGRTWGWPQVLLDTAIDDRDAGVLETAKGTLLVTTFTSLAYEPILAKAEKAAGSKGAWSEARLGAWTAAHRRLNADQRRTMLGEWVLRSTDGGLTWSPPYRTLVSSPHGPIQLADGRLLYAGNELWHGEHRIGVCESTDDGASWHWLATIPTREGDSPKSYWELHAVETTDGRILVQIRNHNKNNAGETLQCESADGGKTWSAPKSIGVWGLPSHLLRLADGRLVMTYGYRRPPFGNQARVSVDQGRSWSEPIVISSDGAGGDLGYPSTVELTGGTLLTVWYEQLKDSPRAVLRQARWTLET